MTKNNAFNGLRYDLGTSSTTQVSKEDVDLSFANPYTVANPCLLCGNTSMFRIIPKNDRDNTAEIQDKGFVCEHCLSAGYLNKKMYGVRPLDK